MQITDIETIPLAIPLEHTIEMASATLTERELVLVRLHTDQGITGLGEFLTATYFSGETQASAREVIENVVGSELVGENPLNVNAILSTIDELVQGNQFAKAAVEMALQDARGKYYDAPVYELLGGRIRDRVPVAWHVGSAPPERAREAALQAADRGFDIIKLKVGEASFDRDRQAVSGIREALGPDADLHLDANQAWSPTEAIRYIREFGTFDVDVVEQPVNAGDIHGLVTVANACDVPILADESIFTGQDLVQYLAQGAYVHPGIKVAKAGGITGAMELLTVAELADVPVCPLGMPGQTSVGGAAALHVASTIEDLPFGSGIGPYYLEDDIVTERLSPRDGSLGLPSAPGLGVELDESKIDSYRTD